MPTLQQLLEASKTAQLDPQGNYTYVQNPETGQREIAYGGFTASQTFRPEMGPSGEPIDPATGRAVYPTEDASLGTGWAYMDDGSPVRGSMPQELYLPKSMAEQLQANPNLMPELMRAGVGPVQQPRGMSYMDMLGESLPMIGAGLVLGGVGIPGMGLQNMLSGVVGTGGEAALAANDAAQFGVGTGAEFGTGSSVWGPGARNAMQVAGDLPMYDFGSPVLQGTVDLTQGDPSWGESWRGSIDNPGLFDPSTPGFQSIAGNIPSISTLATLASTAPTASKALSSDGGSDSSWGESWKGSIDNPGPFDPSSNPDFKWVNSVSLGDASNALTGAQAIKNILNNGGSTDDWLKIGGAAAPGLIGAYAASQQGGTLAELADRERQADDARFNTLLSRDDTRYQTALQREDAAIARQRGDIEFGRNLGAPSRARYEGSYAPDFDTGSVIPQSALDTSTNSLARALSVQGNPYGNPNALAEIHKNTVGNLVLPALNNYRSMNAASGGLTSYAGSGSAVPGISSGIPTGTNLQNPGGGPNKFDLASLNANTGVWNGLGDAVGSVFTPKSSLADLLKQLRTA